MTYAELGLARGISAASATRLAFRRKWPRQAGNDGTARVSVPIGEDRSQTDRTHDDRMTHQGVIMRLVSAFEAATAALRGQLAQANERAEMAERAGDAERNRADRAEQATVAERTRAEDFADRMLVMQAALAAAELATVTERARTDIAEQARREAEGLLARWQADVAAGLSRGLLARLVEAMKGG
jgi:PIN domain nuclease of toxin-antitoxin system